MSKPSLMRQRLLVLFLAALFAFFSPLVLRMSGSGDWLGVPLLYFYLYGIWALVIALAAWVVAGGRE